MSDWLPDVRFGTKDAAETDWRDYEDESEDDDEELAETPSGVVAMLGFDPLDEEFEGAHDSAPFGSVREYDKDGHLHIARTPITRAVVSEYLGREIPNAAGLGLKPDERYKLYRDLEELKKGAETFVGKPILLKHVPSSANDHPRELTVGAIGSPIEIEGDTVFAPLTIWDKEAIEGIENGTQRGLSCGYRYDLDYTPGSAPDGSRFDGRMINIGGNHMALVSEPRVQGAMVADSAENLTRAGAGNAGNSQEHDMPKSALTRKKALDALTAFFSPKLAKDQKIDGLDAVLLALDESEEDKKDDKEAKAKDGDLPEPGGGKGKGPAGDKAKDMKAKDRKGRDSAESLKEKLKDKMSAEDWKAACDDIDGMMEGEDEKDDEDERPDPEDTNKGDKAKDRKAKDEDMPIKKEVEKAMDEAITGERQRQRDVREAERFVRPWVGDLVIAYDSAEDVYKAALEARGKATKGIHPSAYRSILEMLPKPGTENRRHAGGNHIAMDSAKTKGFAEMFPDAMRINLN